MRSTAQPLTSPEGVSRPAGVMLNQPSEWSAASSQSAIISRTREAVRLRRVGPCRRTPPEPVQHHLRQRLNRHARECWPRVEAVTARFRTGSAYVAAGLPGEESLPLCRLRFIGMLHTWGFALYLASTDSYREDILPSGLPTGSPEEALDCAGELYLKAFAPVIRVIFEERDRRIVARLAVGRTAVAESTNVKPRARARLIAIARRFNAPVTILRFNPDATDLLQQYTERGRADLTAADVGAYAAIMARDAGADRLRSEGATTVHDVPGRREATTPAEAAAHFSFA